MVISEASIRQNRCFSNAAVPGKPQSSFSVTKTPFKRRFRSLRTMTGSAVDSAAASMGTQTKITLFHLKMDGGFHLGST